MASPNTATHHLPERVVNLARRARRDLRKRAARPLSVSEVGTGPWERGHVRLYSAFASDRFAKEDIQAFAEAGLGLTDARRWREWKLPGWLLLCPVIIRIGLPRLKSAPQEDRAWSREIVAHQLLEFDEKHGLDLAGLAKLLRPVLRMRGIGEDSADDSGEEDAETQEASPDAEAPR